MSPLRRKRPEVKRTPEWSIRGSGKGFGNKYVKVKVENERATVSWLSTEACSRRSFTLVDLKALLLYVNGVAKRYPQMWLYLRDSNQTQFCVQLRQEDGKLTANTTTIENGFVAWEDLESALEDAVEELESELESEGS